MQSVSVNKTSNRDRNILIKELTRIGLIAGWDALFPFVWQSVNIQQKVVQYTARHPDNVSCLSFVDTDTSLEDPPTTFEDPKGTLYIFSECFEPMQET